MMKREMGFTFIELTIAIAIAAMVSAASVPLVFRVFRGNEKANDYFISVRQSENAGYWIGQDMKMAQSITTDNLTPPNFLALAWTEWDASGNPTYHNVSYFFQGLSGGIGALMRLQTSSEGINQQAIIARQIYFDSSNVTATSRASFAGQTLYLKITSLAHEVVESREYEIIRRINY